MRAYSTALFSGLMCLLLPAMAAAQASVFRDYDHMREVLDTSVMSRDISTAVTSFGAGDEMTAEALAGLAQRIQQIFREDFDQVEILRREEMENGWARELYAFSKGPNYVYISVIYHAREQQLDVVDFQLNTEINALLGKF